MYGTIWVGATGPGGGVIAVPAIDAVVRIQSTSVCAVQWDRGPLTGAQKFSVTVPWER